MYSDISTIHVIASIPNHSCKPSYRKGLIAAKEVKVYHKKNSSCANRLSQLKLVRIDQNILLHIGAAIMDESAALIEKFLFS